MPPDGDGDGDKPSEGGPKKAKFKLSLEGEYISTFSFTNDHCQAETRSEHVAFTTPQSLKVTVKTHHLTTPSGVQTWFAFGPGGPLGWGNPALRVLADVEVARTSSGECSQNLNCARSAQGLEWWLWLFGINDPSDSPITLKDALDREQPNPFPDCPTVFPDIALLNEGKVDERKLYDPSVKRITIHASEEETHSSEPSQPYSQTYTDRLTWTVSLKRIARK